MNLGARIKNLREENGLSQKELAQNLHISPSTLCQYESGDRVPSDNIKAKIADYFHVSIDFLFGRDGKNYKEITPDENNSEEYFALRIHGASMEPRMREGDIVIVRKQEDADTGDTAVVLVGRETATVKKIKKTGDGIQLIPTNPAYDPLYYTAADVARLPVRIIGKVVELRAKY